MTPRERLTPKEIQIAILVWQGLTNREIGKIVGTSEQVIKNHLRSAFDKIGVWSRLELLCTLRATAERIGPRSPNIPFNTLKPLGPISGAIAATPHKSGAPRSPLSHSLCLHTPGRSRADFCHSGKLWSASLNSAKRFTIVLCRSGREDYNSLSHS